MADDGDDIANHQDDLMEESAVYEKSMSQLEIYVAESAESRSAGTQARTTPEAAGGSGMNE